MQIAHSQVLNFLIGVVTVCPQILIPLAADLAPAARRAQSMGIVLSGLMFGVLTARVLGGIIAEFSSWRNVYAMAVATQAVVWASLYFALPDYPPKNPDLKYWEIYSTMLKYIVTNPVLGEWCSSCRAFRRGVLGLCPDVSPAESGRGPRLSRARAVQCSLLSGVGSAIFAGFWVGSFPLSSGKRRVTSIGSGTP